MPFFNDFCNIRYGKIIHKKYMRKIRRKGREHQPDFAREKE